MVHDLERSLAHLDTPMLVKMWRLMRFAILADPPICSAAGRGECAAILSDIDFELACRGEQVQPD